MKAFVNDATGAVERLVMDGDEAFEPERPGTTIRDWPDGLEPAGLYWPAGEPGPVPDVAGQLAIAKAEAHAAVKDLRELHECGGLATPYGPIETDADSQRKISGAVVMAMLGGAAFSIDWRMADNSIATLDAAGMSNLGVLVGQHVSACQYRKNELDADIEAAADLAALEAIDLESGWPGS